MLEHEVAAAGKRCLASGMVLSAAIVPFWKGNSKLEDTWGEAEVFEANLICLEPNLIVSRPQ